MSTQDQKSYTYPIFLKSCKSLEEIKARLEEISMYNTKNIYIRFASFDLNKVEECSLENLVLLDLYPEWVINYYKRSV
jgi:hypothetical protein